MFRLLTKTPRFFGAVYEAKVDILSKNLGEPQIKASRGKEPLTIPSPPETMLGALCVCEFHTAKFWAHKLGIKMTDMQFQNVVAKFATNEATGWPKDLKEVTMDVLVSSDADEKKFDELVKNVEAHCPVFIMFKKNTSNMNLRWKNKRA